MPVFADTSAWVRIARTPALDAATLARAIERLHSPGKLIGAGDAELAAAGVGRIAREHLRAHPATTAAELRWLEHATHHLVPCTAENYPGMLRSYATRPLALYVAGRLDALKDPPLAVVGSRRPTPGGLDNAFEFSRILAGRGVVIASGLAAGIDAAAHRGALAAQGLTLAVLGTGVDLVYPESNRHLCERHPARRRPDQRFSSRHAAPARAISRGATAHRGLESRAPWWSRRRAAVGLADHRPRGATARARGVRDPRVDPQPLEPRAATRSSRRAQNLAETRG